MKTNDISMVLILLLYASIVVLSICTNEAYKEMDNKLDRIASQTDATVERLDSLESDFKTYRTGTKEIIDSICEQLKIHKEDIRLL